MKEYKLKKGWVILVYIFAPLLIIGFGALLFLPFFPGREQTWQAYWFIAPVSIGMIILMAIGFRDAIIGKFVIDHDRVYSIGTFANRTLMLSEIRGYRENDKYIVIEPVDKKMKRIKISMYFERTDEILGWLSDGYPNLDAINFNQEKEAILRYADFGGTEDQRAANLNHAAKIANGVNIVGVLAGGWTLFLPRPYAYAIMASIIMPIIALVIMMNFRGLIRLNQKQGSAFPYVTYAVFAPGLALALRAMLDFNIFDYSRIWIPAVVIGVAYVVIANVVSKEFGLKSAMDYFTIVVLTTITFAYGYGAVVVVNCLFDKSVPQVFHAKVLDKRISSGKTTSYYLELAPWGERDEADEVSVPEDVYDRANINNDVNIYFMEGRFGIPWFEVNTITKISPSLGR